MAQSADLLQQLPLSHACAVLGIGRGSFYRDERTQGAAPAEKGAVADPELLTAIEAITLAFPGYGHLRVTHQLRLDGEREARVSRDGGGGIAAAPGTTGGADDSE